MPCDEKVISQLMSEEVFMMGDIIRKCLGDNHKIGK